MRICSSRFLCYAGHGKLVLDEFTIKLVLMVFSSLLNGVMVPLRTEQTPVFFSFWIAAIYEPLLVKILINRLE